MYYIARTSYTFLPCYITLPFLLHFFISNVFSTCKHKYSWICRLTRYVRAARKWRRNLCKLAAVLQGKCILVLVEMEKNSHSQSNAVSFAVTIFLSVSELCLFKNLSQSVSQEKIDKLCFAIFCLYCIVVSSLSSVLWVASADIECLSVDDANGAL